VNAHNSNGVRQLADVIALARAVPQATIVMCDVGGVLGYGAYAGKKDEVYAAWRASMAELATSPNVCVKLGGMLARCAALNFRELAEPPNSATWAAAWRPYLEPCIELFGAERCNFESNFPVDKTRSSAGSDIRTLSRNAMGSGRCSITSQSNARWILCSRSKGKSAKSVRSLSLKSTSHLTRRWSKWDSNTRSRWVLRSSAFLG
jgi:hypothetical protein